MAVTSTISLRVREGRLGEQIELLKGVKRLVERAGGTLRVHRQIFGSQMNTLVVVGEYKDWNSFAKLRSDPELAQLVERARSGPNPAAESIEADIYEELPI